jgi:hypothetical protein
MDHRFDLENKITENYNFAERLRDICAGILEYDLSPEDTVNALEGLSVMLKLHTDITFETFKYAFQLDEYRSK